MPVWNVTYPFLVPTINRQQLPADSGVRVPLFVILPSGPYISTRDSWHNTLPVEVCELAFTKLAEEGTLLKEFNGLPLFQAAVLAK